MQLLDSLRCSRISISILLGWQSWHNNSNPWRLGFVYFVAILKYEKLLCYQHTNAPLSKKHETTAFSVTTAENTDIAILISKCLKMVYKYLNFLIIFSHANLFFLFLRYIFEYAVMSTAVVGIAKEFGFRKP